jgi:hypothetical protein
MTRSTQKEIAMTKTKKRTRITEAEIGERIAFAQLMIDRGAWVYPSVRRDLATRDIATVEQWIRQSDDQVTYGSGSSRLPGAWEP